jgi:hypothetical protein
MTLHDWLVVKEKDGILPIFLRAGVTGKGIDQEIFLQLEETVCIIYLGF